MPDPLVILVMREFKAGLLARERGQMEEMAREWVRLEDALDAAIADMARQLDDERRAGRAISQSKLYRMERYKTLLAQVRSEFQQYTGYADRLITNGQEQIGQLGIRHATDAINASVPGVGVYFDRLPVEAIQNMVGVGMAGNGSPLRALLEETWGTAVNGLTDALIRSTALGRNPRDTAREMKKGLSQGLNRMLNIARTEQLRVYREAARQQYKTSGVVSGFQRLATHDDRVCAACLMAEGEEYGLDEVLRAHPSGRCTMIPMVDGMPKIQFEAGPEWFRKQPDTTQQSILGAKKWDAWKDGKFELHQLVTVRRDATWGDSVTPTPLHKLVA